MVDNLTTLHEAVTRLGLTLTKTEIGGLGSYVRQQIGEPADKKLKLPGGKKYISYWVKSPQIDEVIEKYFLIREKNKKRITIRSKNQKKIIQSHWRL